MYTTSDITEYQEHFDVEIDEHNERPIVRGYNESGWSFVEIDLVELLDWLKTNKPKLYNLEDYEL